MMEAIGRVMQTRGVAEGAVVLFIAIVVGYWLQFGQDTAAVVLAVVAGTALVGLVVFRVRSRKATTHATGPNLQQIKKDFKERSTSSLSLSSDDTGRYSNSTNPVRCASCGKDNGRLERCARCKSVLFCSHACQKKAWKWHKADC